nr:M67 family peptidase [Acidimicrobiia bacterium]
MPGLRRPGLPARAGRLRPHLRSPTPLDRIGEIVRLREGVKEAVIRHAEACLPDECCGLLAVDAVGRIRFVYPLTNADPSPTTFTIAPEEHFAALRHAERHGWEIGGVFHSHPKGPPELSEVDLAQPHDPDWIHVVVGFVPEPAVRAWRIRGGEPAEVPILA